LKAKHGIQPKVLQSIGVGMATLSEDEVKALENDDSVEAVVKNEIRHIPPHEEETPDVLEISNDPILAYLQGIRDTADLALRFHLSDSRAAPTLLPAPALLGMSARSLTRHAWHLEMMGVHDRYSLTGKSVKIAVLDTGLDLTHPDFQGRVEEGRTAVSFVPAEGVQDGNGHGTHCAGLAAGPAAPQGGRRYAAAPGADLLIGKVLNDNGDGYDSWILDGMAWAVESGAKIISMSLGSERRVNSPFPAAYEQLAADFLNEGILLVAAAGNSSNRPFRVSPVENPAACPSIKAVAAVDRQRLVASFSCGELDSIGDLNVSAPGAAIYSAWNNGRYRSISGTSMATPLVAGVAALFWEQNPKADAKKIWEMLETKAMLIGDARDYGKGLVQAP
jgi:subtilisin family serine protease